MNEFFYLKKSCFVLKTSRFLCFLVNQQIEKYVTSKKISLHIRSYSFHCFCRFLGSIKMKLGQIFSQTIFIPIVKIEN